MHKYREVHWKATLRILTHIKGSLGKELLYKKNGHLRIEAFPIPVMQWTGETESPPPATALILGEI